MTDASTLTRHGLRDTADVFGGRHSCTCRLRTMFVSARRATGFSPHVGYAPHEFGAATAEPSGSSRMSAASSRLI